MWRLLTLLFCSVPDALGCVCMQRLEKHALAAVAHVAALWEPVPVACTAAELDYLCQCQATARAAAGEQSSVQGPRTRNVGFPSGSDSTSSRRGTSSTLAQRAASRGGKARRKASQLHDWHDQPAFTMDALVDVRDKRGNANGSAASLDISCDSAVADAAGRSHQAQGPEAQVQCPGAITQVQVFRHAGLRSRT